MSVSLVKLRGRVRARLQDSDGRMANPDGVTIDMALCDSYIALSSELPAPTLYTASAFTISAGSDLFSLPITVTSSGYGTGTVEYAGQCEIQLASTGRFLSKNTLEQLNAYRDGTPSSANGVPQFFALYQDSGQVVRGRVYPTAQVAYVCNLFSSLKADDLRDYVGTGGSEGLDTAIVNLGRDGAGALVAYTSAMLLKRMDEDAVKARGINPAVADDWMREAEVLLYQEAANRHALESTGQTLNLVP